LSSSSIRWARHRTNNRDGSRTGHCPRPGSLSPPGLSPCSSLAGLVKVTRPLRPTPCSPQVHNTGAPMPDTQPEQAHERQTLRQLIRLRRKSLSQAEQQEAAQQLVAQFKQHSEILAARRIALYLANDGELN